MGHVVGEIYSKVGFDSHFSQFLATKKANSHISCCFLIKKNSLTGPPHSFL